MARVGGHDVIADPARARRRIGVVFQSESLDRSLTVAENLRAQRDLYGISGARLSDRMNLVMTRLGIVDRCDDSSNSSRWAQAPCRDCQGPAPRPAAFC